MSQNNQNNRKDQNDLAADKAAADKAAADKAAADKAAADKAAADKAAADKAAAKKRKPKVRKELYDKYVTLKFLEGSGTNLTKESKKEMQELEKALLLCEGLKPIRTQRAAISNEQVLLVEGIPMPEEYERIIKGCKNPSYYFG